MTDVERTLRRLSSACSLPAAAALGASVAIVWSAATGETGAWLVSPPTESFIAALAAMLLVLLSSAARTRILRRLHEAEAEEGLEGMGPERGESRGIDGLRIYVQATAVSFGMLALAVGMGGWVALRGGASFYGLTICLVSLLFMLARWPRRASFELETERGTRSG